jgi:hypothetical protein
MLLEFTRILPRFWGWGRLATFLLAHTRTGRARDSLGLIASASGLSNRGSDGVSSAMQSCIAI